MERELSEKLSAVSEQVAALAATVEAMAERDSQFVTHSDLSKYLTIAAFDARIDRMSTEIVRQVSGTLQAMVHEALDSAWKEDFRSLYREMADRERTARRAEMREDVAAVFSKVKIVALYFVPFITIVNIIGQWMNWW